MKQLQQMSPAEKEKFFSLDLAERMIRLEQKISASFNKFIHYRDTEYYKSMSKEQQQELEKFLKRKKTIMALIGLLSPLLIISLLSITITGEAILENFISGGPINTLFLALAILIFISIIYLLFELFHHVNKNRKFRVHTRIIHQDITNKNKSKK